DHDTPAFQKAAAADPAAQDVYVQINDAFSAPGKLREAPPIPLALAATKDLALLLRRESRGTSKGYKDPKVDPFIKHRLESMHIFLNQYTDPRSKTYGHWGASVLQTAVGLARGRHCVRTVCKLARQYIHDREILPINPYGEWKDSLLIDEDLAADINLHLQEIGNHITSEKLVQYLSQPEVMAKHGITKKISVRTARRYLHALGYRFSEAKKGQYSDGHEREDVVCERDTKYIPAIKRLERQMQRFDRDGKEEFGPHREGKQVIVWYHNESNFYAHDRKVKNWHHKDTAAKFRKKGDGHSLMVADFVSVDFRW
ncbi:hypothetical protein B0H17DRAFT_910507, partial [Mycena rosella]